MATLLNFSNPLHVYPKLSARVSSLLINLVQTVAVPFAGIVVFLFLWSVTASKVDTSLGKFPGPDAVWEQMGNLYLEYKDEKVKEAEFHQRQDERNAERLAEEPGFEVKIRAYTGKATFPDQIA